MLVKAWVTLLTKCVLYITTSLWNVHVYTFEVSCSDHNIHCAAKRNCKLSFFFHNVNIKCSKSLLNFVKWNLLLIESTFYSTQRIVFNKKHLTLKQTISLLSAFHGWMSIMFLFCLCYLFSFYLTFLKLIDINDCITCSKHFTSGFTTLHCPRHLWWSNISCIFYFRTFLFCKTNFVCF